MRILNLKHLKHLFCGLAALRTWLAARRLAWLVALRAWLGDLVDAEHLEQLKHLKHLFCSDLDQKWAIFWSKSEIETPETPETRGTPETLWAHGLLMPEIFF